MSDRSEGTPSNNDFLQNLNSIRSISTDAKTMLEVCVKSIHQTQKRFPKLGLHFLLETPISDDVSKQKDMNNQKADETDVDDYEISVLYSQTVKFSEANQKGCQHLVHGLGMFRMNNTSTGNAFPLSVEPSERALTNSVSSADENILETTLQSISESIDQSSTPGQGRQLSHTSTPGVAHDLSSEYNSTCSSMRKKILSRGFLESW